GYPGPGPQPGASTNSAIGARATASIDRRSASAGVAHARCDAVDREEARSRQLVAVAVARRPRAAQELDLEQRDRVDQRVAAVDRGSQQPLALEQPALAGDRQQQAARQGELGLDPAPDARPHLSILDQ